MWAALVLVLLLTSIQILNGSTRTTKTVDAPAGLIRGLMAADGNYFMFLGIPYAEVDADNPFGPSKAQQKFKNIFQADEDTAICPQVNVHNGNIQGTLDCLRLNVYVPNSANSNHKLPVMVLIPGGAFMRGVPGRYQFGPKYLVRHDVILVSLHYRYGPYGFMCLDIPEVPGNQGLKDQIIALKWIKDNIESFGGDPEQITIFGFSAGATSISLHLIYADKELFKQTILQSVSILHQVMISTPDKSAPFKISEYLGLTTNSINEALSFLASIKPEIIIETTHKLQIKFGPCIEKVFNGVKAFITETWTNVRNHNVKGKNIMLGINEFEGAHYIKKYYMDTINELISKCFDFDNETLSEMSDLVKHFYLGDKTLNEDIRLSLIDLYSDLLIVHPMQRSLKQYLNGKPQNIYYYMFSYIGGRNNGQLKFKNNFNGAIHGDEIGYLFDPEFITWKPTSEDQQMIDRITSLWTNFAKYGNPTPERTNLLPVKWMPVSKAHHYYLKIGSNLTLENSLFHKRMAFWDLFYKIKENSQKGYVDGKKQKYIFFWFLIILLGAVSLKSTLNQGPRFISFGY